MVLKQFGYTASPATEIKLVYQKQPFERQTPAARFIWWFGLASVDVMQ